MNQEMHLQNTVSTEKTQVSTPLWRWLIYNVAIIGFVASGTLWISGFAQTDADLTKEVQTLKETKLDKTDYKIDTLILNQKLEKIQTGVNDIKEYLGIKK